MFKNSIISIIITGFAPLLVAQDTADLTEAMKDSLVYLEISSVAWEPFQPWRQTAVTTVGAYASAVAPNKILTTAAPLINAVQVRARRYAQNEYIPAHIKVIDYEYNLCLIELETAALQSPLRPLEFSDKYIKGKDLQAYRLASECQIVTARATLDRADMLFSNISFVKTLQFVLTNPSRATGTGEVYCLEGEPIGLACWSSDTEAGLIPAETINRFLADVADPPFRGCGTVGFETSNLLDPAVRNYLKMPDDMRHGVYVSSVYKMGSGSSELAAGDVILRIDGQSINPYGRYLDPRYDRLGLEHLIAKNKVGDIVEFVIWRDGQEQSLKVEIKDINASQMLVPYYHYSRRPEYLVIGGFVFQKLTRDYMTLWGDGWQGKTPPHLYQYFRDQAFNPSEERRDIVLLSYVLPTETNLGYHQLGRLVVKSFNNIEISSLRQIVEAMSKQTESPFHTVEFELDWPTVVIPKALLDATNQQVSQLYGVQELSYIENQ